MSNTAAFDEHVPLVYLDHAAGTPLDPDVLAAMLPYLHEHYANPSSMHGSGRAAARIIADARARIAACIGAHPDEIIFTSGGTESDNLAVMGTARAFGARGTHIITSAIEHKAVLHSARVLEKEGSAVSIVGTDKYGRVAVEDIVAKVSTQPTLVSLMLVNNEIGTIEPIPELAAALAPLPLPPILHTDACQAPLHTELDVDALGVDLMSMSAAKIYGPRGIGVLYKRRGVALAPLIVGGAQEHNLRAGTESLPLIVGMCAALEKAVMLRELESARLCALRDYFIDRLQSALPELLVNGDPQHRAPHIVHVTVPHIEGESMVLMLDEHGIEAATGSACSAHDLKPSHVLSAIGQDPGLMHGSIRFSLGRSTTKKDLDYVLEVFPAIVRTLSAQSALTTQYYAKIHNTR